MKEWTKRLRVSMPYRLVHRTRLNRFQAIDESLASLSRRGLTPGAIIDCGANVGDFARTALGLFPTATVHAIEPQPGCTDALERLRAKFPKRVVIHTIALCSPESDGTMLLMSTDAAATSTGAHINPNGEGLAVPCRTLDSVLAPYPDTLQSALIKLDLQGYELHALKGATKVLRSAEAVMTEVSFYAQAYEPSISELVEFLALHGFELYDIASLYARPRDDRPRQGDFIFVRTDGPLAADRAWS